jgi:RHS repeat-associated protein
MPTIVKAVAAQGAANATTEGVGIEAHSGATKAVAVGRADVPNAARLNSTHGPRNSASAATVTDPQGDLLAVDAVDAEFFNYPGGGGKPYIICGTNSYGWAGAQMGFCGLVRVHDSVSGDRAPVNNVQSNVVYDACGTVVGSGQTSNWYNATIGGNALVNGWLGSQGLDVPTWGVCWGQWTVTWTFSETFTDGQTLTDTNSTTFSVTPAKSPPSVTADGLGGGGAMHHDPTCKSADPVNCASGNFSTTFTDVAVPGRGPGLGLTRTYNSLAASTAGLFGYGWTSPYDAHVTVNSGGSATVFEPDGSQVTGTANGDGTYAIPGWAESTLTQNADGTWSFVRQQTTTFAFRADGRLSAVTDRNGYTTQLSYNSSGQLQTVTDSAGRAVTFSFGTNGFVSQVTDPLTQPTTYGYDSSSDLRMVKDPLNRTTAFAYYAGHLLQTVTDPRLGQTTNVYDSSGRVTQQTDAAGLVTHFSYTGDNFSDAGGTTTITDPHGGVTVENYADGMLLQLTKGSGTAAAGTWNFGYDPRTLGLTYVRDPIGNVTRSNYDDNGNLLSRTDPRSNTTSYTWGSFNEPLTITDPRGIKTTYSYDAQGNPLTKVITGAGGSPTASTTYSYTDGNAGDVTQITDPAGHVTDFTYDSQGDVATVPTHPTSGVSNTTAYVYDALGRKVCMALPNATAAGVQCPSAGQPRVAKTTTWTYDADSELTAVTDPRGNATTYGYDGDGNRNLVTDAIGNVTKTVFDADSRVSTVTAGYGTSAASTSSYSYDIAPGAGVCSSAVAGAIFCTSQTDPGGASTVDYFNSRGERIRQDQLASGTATATYDTAGNTSSLTTSGGTSTYHYNGDNQVTSVTYSSPASGYAAVTGFTYNYDADGNRSSMSDGTGTTSYGYDSLERLTSVTNGAGSALGFGYDLDYEVTSITYPGTGHVINQTYDGSGRESTVADWLSHTTTFSYDANGNLTSAAYPNATSASSTYDDADNPLSIKDAANATPTSPFASFAYSYNADSQLQSETDTGTPSPLAQTYGYDPVDRLNSSSSGGYAYNASGDPTQLLQASQSFTAGHALTAQASTITRVGTASGGDSGTGLSLNVTLPPGVVANDQILLTVTLPATQTIKSTPTGYTLVGTYPSGTTASNVKLALYRRTAQAGDASVTVSFSKTFAKAAAVAVYRGVNPSSPIDASSSGITATGGSVVASTITTTKTNDQLVISEAAASTSAGTWTAPSGMTTRASQPGGPTISTAIADQALTAAGATGSRTATFSVTGSLAAALVALAPAQTTYAYNSLGARTSVTTASGTSTLSYDQLGRLTAYGSTSYAYDADGLRTSKTTGRTAEAFTWEPSGPAGVPRLLVDGTTYYIYGPDGLPLEQISGTTPLYYLHDALGSTRALTSGTGGVTATYTYGPFGSLASSTGTASNPFGYAGSYTDSESGLIYLAHRYYDPETAQFTSVDPLVDATGAPYAYAYDDPVNEVDPTGLDAGNVENAFTGFFDTLTFDLTKTVRGWLGGDNINYCSTAYKAGGAGALAFGMLIPGEGEGLFAADAAAEVGDAGLTQIIKTRLEPGADGGISNHIIEKQHGETISVTHQVTRDGEVIHQHQTYIGKYGGQRRFPNAWSQFLDINAP